MGLSVELTDKGAIYVNNTRITHRGTKWGTHETVYEFQCKNPEDVARICRENGFHSHAKNIDDKRYLRRE